jgi:hypothetical protein
VSAGRSWPGAHGYKPHVVIRQPDGSYRCTRCPFDGDRAGACDHIAIQQFIVTEGKK